MLTKERHSECRSYYIYYYKTIKCRRETYTEAVRRHTSATAKLWQNAVFCNVEVYVVSVSVNKGVVVTVLTLKSFSFRIVVIQK